MSKLAPISVWKAGDAPAEYLRHCPPHWLETASESGRLEVVWVAHVPPGSGWVGWLESREFECCQVSEHTLEDGGSIIFSAHETWCSQNVSSESTPDSTRVIRVWRYGDETDNFTVPSTDDADWVAHVPADLCKETIGWLESGSSFGCCGVDVHKQVDGSELRVGCHA